MKSLAQRSPPDEPGNELAEILSIAAHELRTPATVILGLASTLAASRARMPEEQIDESIKVLDRQAHRLVGLIADLLDLSRIQRGMMEVSLDSVDLTEAVDSALAVVRPPEGVHVEIAVPPGIAVLADAPRLERMLVNLLNNAFRYGGPNVRVEARHVPGGVRFSVVDDGPGVSERVLPHLFQPFRAETGGTGLGLSIVSGLAETFGGSLGYRPGSPSGARFDVTLRAGSAEPESDADRERSDASSDPVTVLIVDDEPDMLFLLRLTLETAGYEVQEAAHGGDALASIQAAKPDILVTDLMMPVMDGRELIRRVREMPDAAGMPIMLLSANPDHATGADVVLQKPFNPRDLTRRVDEMVGGAAR